MNASPADLTSGLPPDLDWLAERFVLGELPPLEEEAVASRLPDDDALATAVARASRLVATVRTAVMASPRAAAEPAPRPRPGRLPSRWLVVAAGATAAAVAWLVWPTPPPRPGGLSTGPGSAAVVELWRAADDAIASESESFAEEDGLAEPDAVPGWMLAAVSLDAADGDLEVWEN